MLGSRFGKIALKQFVPRHRHMVATLMIFGRTELIIGISKAKFCGKSFGEVRFCVAPQKPGTNAENRAFDSE